MSPKAMWYFWKVMGYVDFVPQVQNELQNTAWDYSLPLSGLHFFIENNGDINIYLSRA